MLHHDEVYRIQLVNVINHLLLRIIFLLKHYAQIGQLKEARIRIIHDLRVFLGGAKVKSGVPIMSESIRVRKSSTSSNSYSTCAGDVRDRDLKKLGPAHP